MFTIKENGIEKELVCIGAKGRRVYVAKREGGAKKPRMPEVRLMSEFRLGEGETERKVIRSVANGGIAIESAVKALGTVIQGAPVGVGEREEAPIHPEESGLKGEETASGAEEERKPRRKRRKRREGTETEESLL